MDEPLVTNLERREDFAIHWGWSQGPLAPGVTAVMRVKNEARNLPFVLPPLLAAVERVILVDNGSDDRTADVARECAERSGALDRIEIKNYPFAVSRCGQDHLATPPESVRSLTYFYNWSFAGVRTRYSMKWDGDMILTPAGVRVLRPLNWQLESAEVIVKIPLHPLYVIDERTALFETAYVNIEPKIHPNAPAYRFVKAMDWELRLGTQRDSDRATLPQGAFLELKWFDSDEFSHWSVRDFGQATRNSRKRREWEIFQSHRRGEQHPGLVRVESPAGTHVVDYVRTVWLPTKPVPVAAVEEPQAMQA